MLICYADSPGVSCQNISEDSCASSGGADRPACRSIMHSKHARPGAPGAALLGGAAVNGFGDGGPLGAVARVQAGQRGVLGGGPLLALDGRVQVAPPAAHALLVRAPIQLAADLRPRVAVHAHQLQQPIVLLLRPLLLLYVRVHLRSAPPGIGKIYMNPDELFIGLAGLSRQCERRVGTAGPDQAPLLATGIIC